MWPYRNSLEPFMSRRNNGDDTRWMKHHEILFFFSHLATVLFTVDTWSEINEMSLRGDQWSF